jgi:hypothetical protein
MRATRLINAMKRASGGWSHHVVVLLIISYAFAVPASAEQLTISRGGGAGRPFTGDFTLSPPGSRYFSQGFQQNLPELGVLQAPGGPYHLYQNPGGTWLLCSNGSCGPVSQSSLPLVNKLLQDQKKLAPNDKKQDEKNKPEEKKEHSKKPLEHWCCKNKHEGKKGETCTEAVDPVDVIPEDVGKKEFPCNEPIDQQCPASGNKDGDKPNVKPGEQPKPPAPPGGGNPAPPAPPPPPGGGGGGGGGGNPLGGMSQMLPQLMQALAQKGQQGGQQGQQPGQQQGDLSDDQIMEMARAAQTAIAQATAMTQATAVAQATTVAQATAGIQQTSTASSTTSGETDSSASQTQVAVTPTSSPPANSTF